MNINFFFKHCTDEEKKQARAYMETKAPQLLKLLHGNAAKAAQLDVTIEHLAKKHAYKVTLVLHDPREKLYAFEDDHTIVEAVDFAKDKLVEQMKKLRDRQQARVHAGGAAQHKKEWQAVEAWVEERREVPREAFMERVKPLIHGLRRHIDRELGYAVMIEDIPPGALNTDALLHDVILDMHARLAERPDTIMLEHWGYQIADVEVKGRIQRWKQKHAATVSLERDVKDIPKDKKIVGEIEQKFDLWQPEDDLKFEQFVATEAWVDPSEARSREELIHDLTAWVRVLPAAWREVLFLSVFQGLSPAEIASIQKRSEATVAKDLASAKAYLREQLQT